MLFTIIMNSVRSHWERVSGEVLLTYSHLTDLSICDHQTPFIINTWEFSIISTVTCSDFLCYDMVSRCPVSRCPFSRFQRPRRRETPSQCNIINICSASFLLTVVFYLCTYLLFRRYFSDVCGLLCAICYFCFLPRDAL